MLGILKDIVGTAEDSRPVNHHLSSKNGAGGQHQSRAGTGQKSERKKTAQDKMEEPLSDTKEHYHSGHQEEEMKHVFGDKWVAKITSTRRCKKSEEEQRIPQKEKKSWTLDHL